MPSVQDGSMVIRAWRDDDGGMRMSVRLVHPSRRSDDIEYVGDIDLAVAAVRRWLLSFDAGDDAVTAR